MVCLEGRVASAASYPICPVPELSRPKVLVFLSLWWLLLGVKGEPSELPIGLEACGGTSCKCDMLAMVADGCPSMAGKQARIPELKAFLWTLKPAASLPAQPVTGISLYSIGSWGHGHGVFFISNWFIERWSWCAGRLPRHIMTTPNSWFGVKRPRPSA